MDEWLIEQLATWRTEGNILIDSHPVTKETFGFRVTPFSLDQVRRIGFDAILVLVGEPNTLAQRIAEDRQERPNLDAFQAGFQVQLSVSFGSTIRCRLVELLSGHELFWQNGRTAPSAHTWRTLRPSAARRLVLPGRAPAELARPFLHGVAKHWGETGGTHGVKDREIRVRMGQFTKQP